MTDTEKRYGRTLFDLIAEHPKKTFFIFLSILSLAIALILFRIPFKFGNVEVGENPMVKFDTIITIKKDTVYVQNINKAPKQLGSKSAKNIEIRKDSTIISVQNQPANINTGTNSGIIGNNNEVSVNVKDIQRKLNDALKAKLLLLISDAQSSEVIPKNSKIKICATEGNSEVYKYSNEILQFLKSQKLNVENEIMEVQRFPRVKGVQVHVEKHMKAILIYVGYQ